MYKFILIFAITCLTIYASDEQPTHPISVATPVIRIATNPLEIEKMDDGHKRDLSAIALQHATRARNILFDQNQNPLSCWKRTFPCCYPNDDEMAIGNLKVANVILKTLCLAEELEQRARRIDR
jgi:hypothetical protein